MARTTELGRRYTDTLSGFIGTATGYCEYLDGTPDVRLEGADAAGSPRLFWVKESQIEAFAQ